MKSVLTTLQHVAQTHARRRRSEALLRCGMGLMVSLATGLACLPWSPLLATLLGIAGLLATGGYTRQRWTEQVRSLDDMARLLDAYGQTADLTRTALYIALDRSQGSTSLASAIATEAQEALPALLPAIDVPFRVPRLVPAGLVAIGALWLLPTSAPPAHHAETDALPTGSSPLPRPVLQTTTTKPEPAPTAPGSSAPAASSSETAASGTDQQASGGAETVEAQGIQGGSGNRAAAGDAEATQADGQSSSGEGNSSGAAREAGTSGVSGEIGTAGSPSAAKAGRRGPETTTDGDALRADLDGNTTGMVGQTAAVQDAVQSDAETLRLTEETPDDLDAQTRSVAGTLDLSSDKPQFFDADESSDGEMNGKGGAGGWTVGLSQPGEGGINDASGSSWRTEAGIEDPPDWTEAPSEWVEAAWQDSPAGVVRRVKDGQVGGAGSTDYAAAWTRYAAVAESDSVAPEVPPGRHALIRQYFLAIAPPETP